jgi:hypothetical protein
MVCKIKEIESMDNSYTDEQLKARKIHRIAYVLKGLSEEGQGGHSRLFDTLIEENLILIGRSKESHATGEKYPEHVVPCAVLRNIAFEMYSKGAKVEDVELMLMQLLSIAHISNTEQSKLDNKDQLDLKSTMPPGWEYPGDSRNARLEKANIELIENDS